MIGKATRVGKMLADAAACVPPVSSQVIFMMIVHPVAAMIGPA
ncbi:hypothetical protein APS_2683 [Acetobacter pasteurianus subsp. pasteurianus LMG 1262 = NBRC 106471]|nr:hypothetical protein APS_2683 [Acetobacter pasteurianus subsp. pasteurianus LMG 1262 = NBRC 106471]